MHAHKCSQPFQFDMFTNASRTFTELPQSEANGLEEEDMDAEKDDCEDTVETSRISCLNPLLCCYSFSCTFFCLVYSLFILCLALDLYALMYKRIPVFLVSFGISSIGVVTCTRNACCFMFLQLIVGTLLYANSIPIVQTFENVVLLSIVSNNKQHAD